jgi:hypothetical protein
MKKTVYGLRIIGGRIELIYVVPSGTVPLL